MNLQALALTQPHIVPLLERELERNKPLRFPHVLLTGVGGVGKSTLAKALAAAIGGHYIHVDDPDALTSKGVNDILNRMPREGYTKRGDPQGAGYPIEGKAKPIVLFIDEIHRGKGIQEALYGPMDDFHTTVDGRPSWIPYFTLVAATTDPDALSPSMIRRFPIRYELKPVAAENLAKIVATAFPELSSSECEEVAKRSRNSPSTALDYARAVSVHGLGWFDSMGIDSEGLREVERRYLELLAGSFRPMSLRTLASSLGQKPKVIEGDVEPYLLSLGKIRIGSSGRTLAAMGSGMRGE